MHIYISIYIKCIVTFIRQQKKVKMFAKMLTSEAGDISNSFPPLLGTCSYCLLFNITDRGYDKCEFEPIHCAFCLLSKSKFVCFVIICKTYSRPVSVYFFLSNPVVLFSSHRGKPNPGDRRIKRRGRNRSDYLFGFRPGIMFNGNAQ